MFVNDNLNNQEREREREREDFQVVWWANDPNNPNQNINQNNDNSDKDNDNNQNEKCSKCGIRDAEHAGISIEGKKIYDGPICEPCANELLKCQECKANSYLTVDNKVRTIIRNKQEVFVCEECYKKLKDQEAKTKELKEKFAKLIPMDGGSIEDGVNKGTRTCGEMDNVYKTTELTLEQLKELRNLVEEASKISSECLQKASNGTLCNTDIIFRILDERIKDGKYKKEDPQENPNNQPNRENKSGSEPKPNPPANREPKPNPPAERNPNQPNPPQNQPNQPRKNLPLPSDKVCEGCGASCLVDNWIVRRRWIKHDTNFNEEASYWFGKNCSCEEEFKKNNQQNCGQCQKREFPDQAKGWLLDYEVKLAFCSPSCHIKYRQAKWEKENKTKSNPTTPKPNPTKLAKKVKLFPMELELSSGDKKEFNWEKEAGKKEVLTLKEMSKKLITDTAKNSSKTKKDELTEYITLITKNSFEEAKKDYAEKYGKTELDSLLSGSQVQQSKKSNLPLIIGGGLIGAGLIGGMIFFLVKKQKRYE